MWTFLDFFNKMGLGCMRWAFVFRTRVLDMDLPIQLFDFPEMSW